MRFIAILIFSHVVTLTSGCRSVAESAAECEGAAALSADGHCDAATDSMQPSSSYGCTAAPTQQVCVQGQVAYECVGGATPFPYGEAPDASGCSVTWTDDAGNASYCCTQCSMEGAVCGSPSLTYFCSNPWTPQEAGVGSGAPLGCVALGAGITGDSYCCAPLGTCFAGSTQYLTVSCSSPTSEFFCTGTAVPAKPGYVCTPEALVFGGDGVQGYCCESESADAGADENTAAIGDE